MRLLRVVSLCLLPACLLPVLAAAQPPALPPVQVVHRFTPAMSQPNAPLVQVPSGDFYGTTRSSLFRLTTAGQVTEVARFGNRVPVGGLVLATDGALYGATDAISGVEGGTLFRFDPATSELRTLHQFTATEGSSPLGGLIQVGGSLYGVTRYDPGNQAVGTIFHLVLSTGAVVTDATSVGGAHGPLTIGPDGLLYGLGFMRLYRFDPSTATVTVLRELTVQDGVGGSRLALGADGALYGAASLGGLEEAGTIFRYTPASSLFQRLHTLTPANGFDGRTPGPLVAGGDGHYYGVTDLPNNGTTGAGTLYRLRSGGGGTFTYETLRTLDTATSGKATQAALTLGADGLLYGYARDGGPSAAGTIFRFDPAEGGPPSNPLAFAVLHTFPRLTTWDPAAPVLGADGLLYGLTSAGGAANHGGLYRLDPATSIVTHLGEVPGPGSAATEHSPFARGSDGFLYSASVRGGLNPEFTPEGYDILRADPVSGTVTIAAASLTTPQGRPSDLARATGGELYGGQRYPQLPGVVRFDAAAGTTALTPLWPSLYASTVSALTATSDGRIHAVLQTAEASPVSSRITIHRGYLLRLTPSTGAIEQVLIGTDVFGYVDRVIEGPGGVLYLAAIHQSLPKVMTVNPVSGALAPVCVMPPGPPRYIEHVTLGPDGALYGFLRLWGPQRMFRCDPTTGAVSIAYLPPSVGRVVGPLATVGGALYGATVGANPSDGGALIRIVPGGPLPALDSDGDGLSNEWETTNGLDPFSATLADGAAGDPDGDGITNAEELAAGTHPRGTVTRLFAEGATGPFFQTRFDITVPQLGLAPATIRARFLTDTGSVVAADLVVPARGHLDLDPATLPGLGNSSFSAVFEADATIAVDRTMTWGAGGYGSHVETALTAASTTWYFAEGSTSGGFALFYLLQNPQPTAVTATVTYLRPAGQAPVERIYTLPPNSRTTIVVDDDAAVTSTDVSAAITATAPIVAERAMYLNRPGQPFGAGHESAGVTAPALNWFLAEGATGTFFDLFVLIANPGTADATVEVEYLRSSGGPLTKTYTIPAQSRVTIWVDDEQLPAGSGQKPLAAVNVSTVVRSTNAVPIIVERAMWWPGPEAAADFWYEAHNSPGVTGTAQRWAIGGTEIGGADGAESYILIANTTDTAGTARVLLVQEEGTSIFDVVTVPARSRVTVRLTGNGQSPVPPTGRYGVIVENAPFQSAQVPFVVELATYASPGGVFWARGANALATPIP